MLKEKNITVGSVGSIIIEPNFCKKKKNGTIPDHDRWNYA